MNMPGTMGAPTIIFRPYSTTTNYNSNIGNFMFDLPKVGIVGLGFVGNAIQNAMEHSCQLVLIDKDPKKGPHSYSDLADCEGVFICVPSPMGNDGGCDTSILEEVLDNLHSMKYHGVIISKCTAPPNVYKTLQEKHPNLIHAPEFLTADNAIRDYANGKFAIIGGEVPAYQREAARIISWGQDGLGDNIMFCTIAEAALAKYTINSFLATKVVFMNEIYELANAAGLDYTKIARMVNLDARIGNSHMKVPGPDGNLGFGGMCFPKDTSALLKFAEEMGTPMNVLDAAVKRNTLLRLTEPK